MGNIPIPGDTEQTPPVVRETLPQFPDAPEVPPSPLEERRFSTGGLELRPLAGPDIPIPKTEDEDFIRRYNAWVSRVGQGSIPEYIVWEFLVYIKKQIENVDFVFQSPLFGGRTELGGFVLDYYFPLKETGWRIQGERFHLLFAQDRARDILSRALLEGRGIRVLDLYEDDLLTRAAFTLNAAWEGRELQNPVVA